MGEQIKVEVGQVWRWDGSDYRIGGRHKNGRGWFVDGNEDSWFGDENFTDPRTYKGPLALISPAPPACKAPDRSACKAYCGWHVNDLREDKARRFVWIDDGDSRERYPGIQHCSASCADARLPPVGVPGGTVEAKCRRDICGVSAGVLCNKPIGHVGGCQWHVDRGPREFAKPATFGADPVIALPAATPAKVKVMCPGCRETTSAGMWDAPFCSALCRQRSAVQVEQRGQQSYLEWASRQSGVSMMAKLPERLERPRMARDEMQESDCLEDA